VHTYSTTRFQILLHATELKLLYTAEVKNSLVHIYYVKARDFLILSYYQFLTGVSATVTCLGVFLSSTKLRVVLLCLFFCYIFCSYLFFYIPCVVIRDK